MQNERGTLRGIWTNSAKLSKFDNLSWQASLFLKMSDEEKAKTAEKELPPKQYTEEEAEELRKQLIMKINGIGERMRYDFIAIEARH
jgi:hypothetical protein